MHKAEQNEVAKAAKSNHKNWGQNVKVKQNLDLEAWRRYHSRPNWVA